MPTAQPDPATPTGLEVAERLITAAHRLKQFANTQLAASRTSVPRTRLLAAVQSRPRQRMGDLATRLDITGRTLTVMVDALEQEGLLARTVDPSDRRATLLELTPAGHRFVRQAAEVRDEIWEQAVATLTLAERQQLVHLLSRLAPGIELACGSKAPGRDAGASPTP
jgi:DNA-binding MarR family transcriptional regulator